jgi:hypothetical protein
MYSKASTRRDMGEGRYAIYNDTRYTVYRAAGAVFFFLIYLASSHGFPFLSGFFLGTVQVRTQVCGIGHEPPFAFVFW